MKPFCPRLISVVPGDCSTTPRSSKPHTYILATKEAPFLCWASSGTSTQRRHVAPSCMLQKHAVHLQSRRTHTTWSTQHAGVVVRCRGHALIQPQDALPPCWCQDTLMESGMTANKQRPPSVVIRSVHGRLRRASPPPHTHVALNALKMSHPPPCRRAVAASRRRPASRRCPSTPALRLARPSPSAARLEELGLGLPHPHRRRHRTAWKEVVQLWP